MSKEKNERRKLMHRAKDPLRDTKDIRFDGASPNAPWFKPTMFTFFGVGFIWILLYTLSQGLYPVANWGAYNMLGGFGCILVGFMMSTQWRS